MNNTPEEYVSKIQPTELLRPGVVKIPYALNGKRWDVIIYNENNGFKIRINKYTNNIRKKIKDKEASLPKRKTNSIEKNKTVFIKELGMILDSYVGTNRPKILQKAEDAYTLLMEEERDMKINETGKKIYNIFRKKTPKKKKESSGEKTQIKKIKTEEKHPHKKKLIKNIATIGLAGILALLPQKTGLLDNKKQNKEETKKEIIVATDEGKKIEKGSYNNTAVVDRSTGKLIEVPIIEKKTIYNNTGEDEVFTIIETIQPDPNDNDRNANDRYTGWKSLSQADQNIVKTIYKNVTTTDDKKTINAIINGLDKKILLGLYDICVKKSFILKKQGHDAQLKKMMVITQLLVDKQDQLIKSTKTVQTVEKIKEIQNMISTYTVKPKGFTIEKATGDKVFEYSSDESKPLIERVTAINFTVQHDGKEIGTIGFDTKGKVITQHLSKNNQTYTVSQNRTTIKLTEGYLVSN